MPAGDYGFSGTNNLVEFSTVDFSTVISADDPIFATPPNLGSKTIGDLRIQPGSPAIDVGNEAIDLDSYTSGCCEPIHVNIGDVGVDLRGNPRIQNSLIDLGAHELEPFYLFMDQIYPGISDLAIVGYSADPDADLITNLQEWAYGLDPDNTNTSGITLSGLTLQSPGLPIVYLSSIATGVDFRAMFGRLIDYEDLNVKYTVQFSSDLTTWYDSTEEPTFLDTNGTIDLVSVPYPFFLPNFTKAKFFRVVVTFEQIK